MFNFLPRRICLYGAIFLLLNLQGALYGEVLRDQIPDTKGISLIDAVRITLKKQPNILLEQQQVEISKGLLQTQKGEFNPRIGSQVSHGRINDPLKSSQITPGFGSIRTTDTTVAKLSLTKKLRSGIELGPDIELTRTDDPFQQTEPVNTPSINFNVSIPLLKGQGRDATAADEMAAEVNVEASRLVLLNKISESISRTVQAYWGYRAAQESLEISRALESMARLFRDNMQKLIDADERPAADIAQLMSNLATKTSDRIAAEQRLLEARQFLGLEMGLPSEEIVSLGPPTDPFPEILPREIPVQPSVEAANRNRKDLMALKEQEKSAEILLVAAKKNLKPRTDFTFSAGYRALSEGGGTSDAISAFNDNVGGLNFSGALVFEYPYGNDAAKGTLRQRLSGYQQALIRTSNLEREIRSNVVVRIEALRRSILELRKARDAVDYSQKALENGKERLLMGMYTVVELVDLQDRFNRDLLVAMRAEENYATSIIRLRFEMGTLVSDDGEVNAITREDLTAIPQ